MSKQASDNPIREIEEDRLDRAPVAESYATNILRLDATEGLVVGILGPWGSGKTSFINLTQHYLAEKGAPTLKFNPWMFSGAEQLVEAFFVELSSQLGQNRDFTEIGDLLEHYGEIFAGTAWIPIAGPWFERARLCLRASARILRGKRQSLDERRYELEQALRTLNRPITVVVDDIDRLTTPEIRELFKLVRLTASFPNIIYILAFDRVRVESALKEEHVPGRDYLEKILQVAVDLPHVPDLTLRRQVLDSLEQSIGETHPLGDEEAKRWPDVFTEVIAPLIRNIRDVKRYVATARGTVEDLSGKVSIVDVLAMEAIRVFLPDMFHEMARSEEALTTISPLGVREDPAEEQRKQQVTRILEISGNETVARAAVDRLFPAASHHFGGTHYGPDWHVRWLRERRMAHEELFRLYVSRVVGEKLKAFEEAERASEYLNDRERLESHLRALPAEQWEDVISALEAYSDDLSSQHVVPATIVLLNVLPDIPDRPRGMFEFDAKFTVRGVVLRIMGACADETKAEEAVNEVLPEVTALSARWELISLVGNREGEGHRLVADEATQRFEREFREQLRQAGVGQLASSREYDLLRILVTSVRAAREEDEEPISVPDDPEMTKRLFNSAWSETRSQAMGSRHIERSPRLAWEGLVEVYGDEDTLKERIDSLRNSSLSETEELLSLADRYLGGWRPGTFD